MTQKTIPRKVDFSDANTPDSTAMLAIKYGKSYKAAVSISGLTAGQVGYRVTKLRKAGVLISPWEWRNAALPKEERRLRRMETNFRHLSTMLADLKRLARSARNGRRN